MKNNTKSANKDGNGKRSVLKYKPNPELAKRIKAEYDLLNSKVR